MAADGSIVIDVVLNDNGALNQLNGIQQGANNVGNSSGGVERLASAFYLVTSAAKLVVGAISTVASAAFNVGNALVTAAGDAQALNAQFSTVFGTLETEATNALNAIGQETNILPSRLQGAFTQIAAFAKTSGQSTAEALDLTSRATIVAADSAAFYDRSIEDVTESLQSFLKGNYENDSALGISATETTRNAIANELYGQSFIELSEAQKQLALLALVEQGNELSGALGQASREGEGLQNVTGNLKQAFTDLQAELGAFILEPVIGQIVSLTTAIQGIDVQAVVARIQESFNQLITFLTPFIEALSIAFGTIRASIENAFATISPYIQIALETIKGLFDSNIGTIVSTFTTVFQTIADVVALVLDTVSAFVGEKLAVIFAYFEENGASILQAVTNAFNLIKAVFDFIFPAVVFVVQFAWDAIKQAFDGALNIILGLIDVFRGVFTGDWSAIWDGVKSIFSGAIDLILGLMSLSFLGGIRAAVANLAKSFTGQITTLWNTVKGLFTNSVSTVTNTLNGWVSGAINIVKGLATNFTSTVGKIGEDVVRFFVNLVTDSIAAVSALPGRFVQIGKDTVQGLIDGFKSLNPVKIIGDIAGGAIDKARDILGINSPSKVFTEIGEFVSQGFAIGIEKDSGLAVRAIDDLGSKVINPAQQFASVNIPGGGGTTNNSSVNNQNRTEYNFVVQTDESVLEIKRLMRRQQFGF